MPFLGDMLVPWRLVFGDSMKLTSISTIQISASTGVGARWQRSTESASRAFFDNDFYGGMGYS